MILTDLHPCRTHGIFLFKYSLCSTAPRQLCSDCVLTLLVFGFYLFVFLLINASALCTWLRHPHVMANMPRSRSGCVSLVSEPRFRSPAYFVSRLIIVMSSVRIMLPRMDARSSVEPSFPDVAQLGEAIANAIQALLRFPKRTLLETVYNLKLPMFKGSKDHEVSERWLEHVEKTF